MSLLQNLWSPDTVERSGWMLVHFLWQAAAVARRLIVVTAIPAAWALGGGCPLQADLKTVPETRATPPAGSPRIGIYLITARPERVPADQVPLSDFTLADEPLVCEADILRYDCESGHLYPE